MLIRGTRATVATTLLCVLLFLTETSLSAQNGHGRSGVQVKPNQSDNHASPPPTSEVRGDHTPHVGSETQNGHAVPPNNQQRDSRRTQTNVQTDSPTNQFDPRKPTQFKPTIRPVPKWPPIHTFPGLTPLSLSPEDAQLRGASRTAWESAVNYELQSKDQGTDVDRKSSRQQALIEYEQSVDDLEETKNSQGALLAPGTYVPLAKSHLDAARMLYLLGEDPEADAEVRAAESLLRDLLLHQDPTNPLPRGWLWRIYYLLGDVNLYESNASIALFDYQKAQTLKPNFVPASAMTQYLGRAMQPVQISLAPGHQDSAATQPPSAMAAKSPPPPPTPSDLTEREKLLREMQAISSSKSLSQAADFVSLSATLLGITELAPVADALKLSEMIIDYAVK
jgi:tetratricopeptide (TPR) repeat protein